MDKKENLSTNETSPKYLVKLVAVLTAISVLVAAILAAVNFFTKDKIADNGSKAKEKAVLSIFTSGDESRLYKKSENEEIYLAYKDGDILGYCVFISSSGFSGDIDMMVGISSDYTTAGVKIVSMSETPGVGSKTNSDEFLSRFIGGNHSDPVKGCDAISGATISSKAVADGVAAAHGINIDLEAVAAEVGASVIQNVPESDAEETNNEPDESESSADVDDGEDANTEDTTPDEPSSETDPEPEPPSGNDNYVYGEVGGDPSYRYGRYAETAENQYRIEISRSEETAEVETDDEDETEEE